jgi:hypothetical protein
MKAKEFLIEQGYSDSDMTNNLVESLLNQYALQYEQQIKDLKESQKFYFVEGYEYGHNHTVESAYTDAEQVYEDFKQALK